MSKIKALKAGLVTVAALSSAVLAACGGAHPIDNSAPESSIQTSSSQEITIADTQFTNLVGKLSAPERQEFSKFLKAAACGAINCNVNDIAFNDKSALADYFYEHVLGKQQKGLVVASSHVFTAPVKVCWTDDSDATAEEKAAVIANVEATWATYSNVSFDWYGSGTTPSVCTQAQSTAYDVKIWQDSSQTRGCSYVGKNSAVGIGCSGSVAHPWANMLLEVRRGTNRDSYVAVHEMGHAIGLYHEQDRDDSTCTSGAGSEVASSRRVGEYDALSIMNYCSVQNGDISSGDVASDVFLYGSANVSPIFSATSWVTTDITYTATFPDGTSQSETQTSVGTAVSNFAFGAVQSGALLDVTPSDNTLSCRTEAAAPRLRNNADRVLYFVGGTIPTECYSPALISVIL